MPSLNQVTLIGNLTRPPEGRRTNSGTAVCELGLAINEKYNGEDKTVFVDITVWGKTADFCRDYLQKGASIAVIGRLQLDTWTDKQSGQNRSKLKVVADRIQSLTPKQSNQNPAHTGYTTRTTDTMPRQAPQAPPPPPPFPEYNVHQEPPPEIPVLEPGDEPLDDVPFR